MSKVALYDILVPGEGALVSEEIPAGQPIPAKYRDKMKEWEERGMLTDSNDAEVKALQTAETKLEEAEEQLLEAAQAEAAARAKVEEKEEERQEALVEPKAEPQPAQRGRKPASK